MKANESLILESLRRLDPARWDEVLDFIAFLQSRAAKPAPAIRTARDLLNSELVGLWADRADISDSLDFARHLRQQAERRSGASSAH